MSERRDRVDDLLRRMAGDPDPQPGDRAQAEARLAAAIDAERRTVRRRGWRVVTAAVGLLVVVVATLVVVDVGGPSQVSATMEEIAEVVEEISPLSVDDTQFFYTQTESQGLAVVPRDGLGDVAYDRDHLVYLELRSRETWRSASGVVQFRDTIHPPVFFTPEAEAVYYQAGLDESDQVGETTTQTFHDPETEDWPDDPEALDAAIRDVMTSGRGLPEPVEYLDVALDIIRRPDRPPGLRAAVLRLIGDLDGLQLGESPAEQATFSIEYTDRDVRTRLTFTITNDGHLSFEETRNLTANEELGIPADTAVWAADYTTPVIVDSLDPP